MPARSQSQSNLPDSAGPYSPRSTASLTNSDSNVLRSASSLHLPPPAPRMRNIPLPHEWGDRTAPPVVPYYQEPFPIDLRSDLDLEHLTLSLLDRPSTSCPPQEIVTSSSSHRATFQLPPVTIVRRLCRTIRGPLSLRVYQSELSPETQQAVCRAFLARGGSRGRKIWQDFLNGNQHPDGPKGELLLHGHLLLWGFRQDGQHQWIVDVDVERHRAPSTPRINYSY
ncbi:hypothetical protein B0H14DRAFT_3685679 [Mycena olivaceomarginata]|nr:hypothetical protein B0H14DRAFT_3685679 [Mycena olivaceomarginata]